MDSEAPALFTERRRNRRFPISLELRYILSGAQRGEGRVLDISSGGILFQSGAALPAGKQIQLILTWPFLLNGECPLRLYIHGRILRGDGRGTAVQIGRYEFRTAPKAGQTDAPNSKTPYTGDRNASLLAALGR